MTNDFIPKTKQGVAHLFSIELILLGSALKQKEIKCSKTWEKKTVFLFIDGIIVDVDQIKRMPCQHTKVNFIPTHKL